MPERARPLMLPEITALAGIAAAWVLWDVAVILLLGYHCILRTCEMVQLRVSSVVFLRGETMASLTLENTKSGQRMGITERVTVTCPTLVKMLKH